MEEKIASDTAALKRKMLLGMLASPATVMPFLIGVTGLLGTWALDMRPDVGILLGLIGVLGSGGMFLTQLLVRGEDFARRAIKEAQLEAQQDRERMLDELDGRLSADQDPRTESALRDLRSLAEALDELQAEGVIDLDAPAVIEIRAGTEHLITQCITYLERSLSLWHTGQKMATNAARKPILEQREKIVKEVFQSIRQLGKLHVALQNLSTGVDQVTDLARIRDELDQNLAVAKRVDERMKALEDQFDHRIGE